MTFRARVLIAFTVAALVPLGVLTIGVRHQLDARLRAEYERGADDAARTIREELSREGASIGVRLAAIAHGIEEDDDFRLAMVRGAQDRRAYVLDYATRAMQLSDLAMLQLQDDEGRVVSSGHFRNEFDRLDLALVRALAASRDSVALVRARAPEGTFLALARADSFRVGGRRYYVVGGATADVFLSRVTRGADVTVAWSLSSGEPIASDAVTRSVPVPFVNDSLGAATPMAARLVVTRSLAGLSALQRDVGRWFAGALLVVVIGVVALAAWLSARLTHPLEALALATTRIDLDRTDVALPAERDDEVGTVARRLRALATRLRASALQLRDAERRATVGDMARQVNHDIKNGLIPLRNVLRHLGDVGEREPDALPGAFAERRGTLDASVDYLDTLARNYARLSPQVAHEAMDVNAVVRDAASSAGMADGPVVQTRLTDTLPRVNGDRVILRRIMDNLIRNGVESLDGGGGRVTVTTALRDGVVAVSVVDTGRGMNDEERAHAFDDFYTTKTNGTGLGLSVVRRLTADLGGSIRVESTPGHGTTFTLELPV